MTCQRTVPAKGQKLFVDLAGAGTKWKRVDPRIIMTRDQADLISLPQGQWR